MSKSQCCSDLHTHSTLSNNFAEPTNLQHTNLLAGKPPEARTNNCTHTYTHHTPHTHTYTHTCTHNHTHAHTHTHTHTHAHTHTHTHTCTHNHTHTHTHTHAHAHTHLIQLLHERYACHQHITNINASTQSRTHARTHTHTPHTHTPHTAVAWEVRLTPHASCSGCLQGGK